nr:unnamed protein product [Callosobruchus analis]
MLIGHFYLQHQLCLTAVIEPPTAEEPPGSSAVMELSTTAEESSGSFAVMEPLTTAEEPLGSSDENNSGEPPRKRPKLQDLDASDFHELSSYFFDYQTMHDQRAPIVVVSEDYLDQRDDPQKS